MPEQLQLIRQLTSKQIRDSLTQIPATPEVATRRRAAVAMVLCGPRQPGHLLFIRRSEYPGDPWSGDVAFPGGGVEKQDACTRETAERETLEEIGLTLPSASYLGPLGAITGDYLPIRIACHVYHLNDLPDLELNAEVVETFCVPLEVLLDPQRSREHSFEYRGECLTHPIINLEGYCERFLWGISYRLLQKFFVTLGVKNPIGKVAQI